MDSAKALVSGSWQDYAYIEVSVPDSKFKFTRVAEPIKASRQDNVLLVQMEGSNMKGYYGDVAEKGIYMFPFEQIQYFVLVPDEYYDPEPEADAADDPVEDAQPTLGWLVTAKKKWEKFANSFKGWTA